LCRRNRVFYDFLCRFLRRGLLLLYRSLRVRLFRFLLCRFRIVCPGSRLLCLRRRFCPSLLSTFRLRIEERDDLLGRSLRDHELFVIDDVVDIKAKAIRNLRLLDVSRRKHEVRIIKRIDDQRLRALCILDESERCESGKEILRLRSCKTDLVNDDQIAFAKPFRKSRAKCTAAHLLRHLIGPVAGLRPVNITATFPERRTKRCDTRTACSFLFPKFAARTRNVAASFRRGRSLSAIRTVIHYRGMDERFVQLDAKYSIGQRNLADFLILQIANLYGRHKFLLLRVRASARFFKVWPLALPYALLAFPNYHQTSIRSRNRTADHQQVIININLCDRKAFDRYPVVAHVA